MVCSERQIVLPDNIKKYVGSQKYVINDIGMSKSEVRIYDKYVLKIQPESRETDNEYLMVNWLGHDIPVPSIPVYCKQDGLAYMLMTKVSGEMLCATECLTFQVENVIIKCLLANPKSVAPIDIFVNLWYNKCKRNRNNQTNSLHMEESLS